MRALKGQVAVVTGASMGIGRAIATAFAGEGAYLVLVARGEERLRSVQRDLLPLTDSVRIVTGDVRDEATAARAMAEALDHFGRLDILVNNAGLAIHRPIAELTVEQYDTVMDTNMRGTFLFSRAAVAVFQAQGRGRIINVGSGAGVRGVATESAYCASKFAQRGFALALDQELRPQNIRVSTITSGDVDTGFAGGAGESPRLRTAGSRLAIDDIARAAVFVATQTSAAHVVEITVRALHDVV